MLNTRAQKVLIAYIRLNAPQEYAVWRAELRNEFADLMACLPTHATRRYFGEIYRQRKAAMVIATARFISMHP